MQEKQTLTAQEMEMLKGFQPDVNYFGAGRFFEE